MSGAFVRTSRELDRHLMIVHDRTGEVYWGAVDALSIGAPNTRHLVEVLAFQPLEREPAFRLWADVLTPEAAINSWKTFLTPPVTGSPPTFGPDIIREIAQPGGYVVSAKLDRNRNGGPDTLRALIGVRHLDHCAILEAVRLGVSIVQPHVASTYDIEWEFDVPRGYGAALFDQHLLRQAAHRAETRQEHMHLRAEADDHWMQCVLPLRAEADATRLIYEPEDVKFAREASWVLEDKVIEGAGYTPRPNGLHSVSPRLLTAPLGRKQAAGILSVILRYRDGLRMLPGVDPDPAIRWLEGWITGDVSSEEE